MHAFNGFDDLMFTLTCSQCKFECEEQSYVSCFELSLEEAKD